MNRTVATSAMPIGMPGWPDFAFSTASIASARIALAISALETAVRGAMTFILGRTFLVDQARAERRPRSTSLRIIGVRMSCMAMSILPPGMTIELARLMKLLWIIESR